MPFILTTLRRSHSFIAIMLSTAILGGWCASAHTNPDCDSSEMFLKADVPSTWQYLTTDSSAPEISIDDNWWKCFDDSLLDSLVTMGLDNNYDVSMAARRVGIARNTLNIARAAYFPQLSLSAGWNKTRTSGRMASSSGSASTVDYFSAGIDMNWEIDLFGKITSQANVKKEQWKASRAEWAGVMLSLEGSIVRSYIQLREWQAQLQVAAEHSESQLRIVRMVEARKDAGMASMLDVAQAKTVYYSTQASVPVLENSINSAINSLATLLGVYPDQVRDLLAVSRPLPSPIQLIQAGIPMNLLRRRPDIVQAEKTLAAQAAQLGVAKKDFFPSLSLNGSISTSAHRAGDLFSGQSFGYTIAPTLSWTIFNGLERKNNLNIARQELQNSIDSYNLTVMTAVQETDNALSSYYTALRHIDRLNEVVDYTAEALRLSVDRYKSGLDAFNNVVDAQLTLLENQNSVIVAEGDALTALVNIYIALGGGWDASGL